MSENLDGRTREAFLTTYIAARPSAYEQLSINAVLILAEPWLHEMRQKDGRFGLGGVAIS